MTEALNKNLYLAWLKEKGRKRGDETLDCVHVVVDPAKGEAEVREFVKQKIAGSPNMFFIKDLSPENIEIELLKIAYIEKGEVDGAVLME